MGFDEAGVRRRSRTAFAVLATVVCALMLPAGAAAETFEVNSVGDQVDSSLGDGACLTGGGTCTLRAAIEEANALSEGDSIRFDETTFGGAGATIVLADPLTITERLAIVGTRECTSGATKPCVGISGPLGETALTVQGANEVEIERLAITDAALGIDVEGATEVKIFGVWLGVGVGGGAGSLQAGVAFGSGSDRARIGQPAEGQGNLFANIDGVALDLFGVSGARVYGNRFGVKPDGLTPAANGDDIEVTSDASGGVDAVGNEIGARVAPGLAGGPCDEWCNVISGATGTGLDLQGDGGDEAPAVGTTVQGNYFGLSANGMGSVPNAGAAIRVGAAERTVIGGTKAGDANRFSGGAVAVEAGPGAPDVVVRGNRIGVDGLDRSAPAPAQGLAVDSTGIEGAATEAILAANELRMGGGTGILHQGFGAWIFGNEISGAATGIHVTGAGAQGNMIQGNTVASSTLDAILLENGLNEVVGNRIAGAGRAGVVVRGGPPFGVDGNVIGGDSEAAENEISGAAAAAIEVENTAGSVTTVARNRGSGNGGLFIDLVPAAVGEGAPNGGIAPPSILSAGSAGVVGTAEPGAVVRVFRKQSASAGEIAGFLGSATVDEEGDWALAYGAPIPLGTGIAASQTDADGASSELALATTKGTVADEAESASGDGVASRADRRPPRSAILRGPRARSTATTARFRFASDERGTRFQCRLDRGPFRPCRSPWRYRGLRPGRHVFTVRAIDAAGNTERTPAKRAFVVLGER